MKALKYIAALMLCSTLFVSCSNTETDEELQMHLDYQEFQNVDSGGAETPPIHPTDPGDD